MRLKKKYLIETLITTHCGGMFMNILQATETCLKKYFIFSGRAKRSEFWWFYLFTVIVSVVYTSVIDNLLYDLGLLQLLHLPESILHSKVESSSLLLNWKVADWLLVGLSGPEDMGAIGSVRSMVQL